MTNEREPGQAGAPPVAVGPADEREDRVEWDSEKSFPASDPPGWAGSASVSREAALRGEEPPAGPPANWSVEDEAKPEQPSSASSREDGGSE